MKDILADTEAMTCFIPRSRTTYKNLNYAFVAFASDEKALNAFNKNFQIKGNRLYWAAPDSQHCYVCGDPAHKSQHCTNRKMPNKSKAQFDQLYQKYKPAQYRIRAPARPRDQNQRNYNNSQGYSARNNQKNR